MSFTAFASAPNVGVWRSSRPHEQYDAWPPRHLRVLSSFSTRPVPVDHRPRAGYRRHIVPSCSGNGNIYGADLVIPRSQGVRDGLTLLTLSTRAALKRSRTFVEKIKALPSEEWEAVLQALHKAERELVKDIDGDASDDLYRPGVNVHMYTACISQLTKAGRSREALDIFLHRMSALQVMIHRGWRLPQTKAHTVVQVRSSLEIRLLLGMQGGASKLRSSACAEVNRKHGSTAGVNSRTYDVVDPLRTTRRV